MFGIPTGGELYVYNPEKSHILGPYTSKDNHESGLYAIPLIAGDELFEYYQPIIETNLPEIRINQFAYAYRAIDFGDSDDCQVNVNCSEGNDWQNQINASCKFKLLTDGVLDGVLERWLIIHQIIVHLTFYLQIIALVVEVYQTTTWINVFLFQLSIK